MEIDSSIGTTIYEKLRKSPKYIISWFVDIGPEIQSIIYGTSVAHTDFVCVWERESKRNFL